MGVAAAPKQGQFLVPITYSLQDWEEELQTVLNELDDIRLNRLGKLATSQVKKDIDTTYDRVHYTHDYITRAREAHTRIKEALEVSKTEAEYKSIVLSSWPERRLPGRASLLGGGLLGAGSGALIIVGLAGAIIFWLVGLVVLAVGLLATRKEDTEKADKYTKDFLLREVE